MMDVELYRVSITSTSLGSTWSRLFIGQPREEDVVEQLLGNLAWELQHCHEYVQPPILKSKLNQISTKFSLYQNLLEKYGLPVTAKFDEDGNSSNVNCVSFGVHVGRIKLAFESACNLGVSK